MRKTNFTFEKSGFTLVESLVTMLIFAFVAAGIYSSVVVGERSWEINKARIEAQQELREALEWMKYDLCQAGDSSIIDVPDDDTWYSSISFRIPSTDPGVAGRVIDWDTDIIQFALEGTDSNELHKIIGGTTTKILAQNIKTLQFKRLSTAPDILEVSMVSEQNSIKGEPYQYQLDFKVKLRN